jgi:branched-chain amino acid transport system ATP-binding protein
LLDEPAAGLSSVERHRLTQLLLSLDRAITLVMVEHDMDVALTVAERVTVMHRGAVVVEGSPLEIRQDKLVRDIYLGRSYAV